LPIVDVRDVAQAHLLALKISEAKNKRFVLCAGSLWFSHVCETLKIQYPNHKVKSDEMGLGIAKFASWFDKSMKNIIKAWGKDSKFDNSRSKNVLGLDYYEPKQSILAMAESLFESGQVTRK
jgi:nucleoside-diphosphate-sugar epimerase